jgi:hypothetical protein
MNLATGICGESVHISFKDVLFQSTVNFVSNITSEKKNFKIKKNTVVVDSLFYLNQQNYVNHQKLILPWNRPRTMTLHS